jgi:hypothetical protein
MSHPERPARPTTSWTDALARPVTARGASPTRPGAGSPRREALRDRAVPLSPTPLADLPRRPERRPDRPTPAPGPGPLPLPLEPEPRPDVRAAGSTGSAVAAAPIRVGE